MILKYIQIPIFLIAVTFLPATLVSSGTIGATLPEFMLTTPDGVTIDSKTLAGKQPVVLVFWATWCPGCKKEIPELNKLYDTVKKRGITFIGVDVGMNDSPERMVKFAAKYGIKYPVAFDTKSTVTTQFKIQGIPTIIISDSSGVIRYRDHSPPKSLDRFF